MFYIIVAMFLGLPLVAAGWFVCNWLEYRKLPEDSQERKGKKIMLILSGIVAGVLLCVVGGLAAMFVMAIAFM